MKKLIALLLILVLAAGGYYWHRQEENKKHQATQTVQQKTTRAEKDDISITVSATGRVEAEREVEIKSKASGEVIKVNADISDTVEQGALLFKLDPADEERSVAKLKATLAMSKAKLAQTKLGIKAAEAKLDADTTRAHADLKSARAERDEYESRLRRARELFGQNVISREEFDTAVTRGVQTQSAVDNAHAAIDQLTVQALELDKTRQEIAISEAQVETDTVALEDALQRLKDTEVFAPITGVVSERTVQEGLIVASGVSNVGGGTTAMRLIDVTRIYAIAAVDEADIAGVVPGVKATITADAYKDVEFPGEVVRVAATGSVESNVVTFDVKVEITGRRKALLKPEMTTNVTLLVDERKGVVLVPASAVVRKAVAVNGRERSGSASGSGERAGVEGGEARTSGSGSERMRMDYSRRKSYVTVVKPDGSEEEREVRTGITDGHKIVIEEGVVEGEEVLLQDAAQSRWAGSGGQQSRRPPPPF